MTDLDPRGVPTRGAIEERLRTFLHRSVSVPMPPTLSERLLRMASRLPSLPVRQWRPPVVGAAAAGFSMTKKRGAASASVNSAEAPRRLDPRETRAQRLLAGNPKPWRTSTTLAQRIANGGEDLEGD